MARTSPLRFHVDEPLRWDNPVSLLVIRGWCFDSSGALLDEVRARTPEGEWSGVIGLPRPDVAATFPRGKHAGESGFKLRVPRPKNLPAQLEILAIFEDGHAVRFFETTLSGDRPPEQNH